MRIAQVFNNTTTAKYLVSYNNPKDILAYGFKVKFEGLKIPNLPMQGSQSSRTAYIFTCVINTDISRSRVTALESLFQRFSTCDIEEYATYIKDQTNSIAQTKQLTRKRKVSAVVLSPEKRLNAKDLSTPSTKSSSACLGLQKPKKLVPDDILEMIIINSSLKRMCACGCGLLLDHSYLCRSCLSENMAKHCVENNIVCRQCKPLHKAHMIYDLSYMTCDDPNNSSTRYHVLEPALLSTVSALFAKETSKDDIFDLPEMSLYPRTCIIDGGQLNLETFQTLSPGRMLGQTIIDFYANILQERSIAFALRGRKPPSVFLHTCLTTVDSLMRNPKRFVDKHFPKLLMRCGVDKVEEFEYIFFPAYHDPLHWVLYVFEIACKKCIVYDSMFSKDPKALKTTLKTVDLILPNTTWAVEYCGHQPKQDNGYDCGIFVIMTMDYLMDKLHLNLSCTDMPYFRNKIACDIIRGYVLYDK